MNGSLTLLSAFLLGLIASGHCLLMCGGISGALAVATRTDARGRPRLDLLACYQIGRIASYALAGASVAGIGSALLSLVDQEQ
jgi:sulfite exporter TauE/SafE